MTSEHRFILFVSCIVAASAGGYLARRRGWLNPNWARPIMSAAIIGCDAPIAWLAIWFLALDSNVWKVPAAGAAVGVATSLVGLWIARWRRLGPAEAPLFALQGSMGNVGYTLGGALAFMIWDIQGLALEQMFCMMWPFFAFLFCFPIGRHYGEMIACSTERLSPLAYGARTLWRSLTDLRSLPLYMATLGLALNLHGAPPPEWVKDWHLIDGLMVLGILMQFGGVGMTVQARKLPVFWKLAMGSATLKFLVSPALMLAATALAGMPWWSDPRPFYVCMLLSVMPTALYSVLMANLFNLNRDLANTTFVLTHALCFAVLVPVIIVWRAVM